MPDAAYYCRQSEVLQGTASRVADPAVADRLRSLAEDYRAIAALLNDGVASVSPAGALFEDEDTAPSPARMFEQVEET
jgi:hypothetical protein